MLEGAGSLRWCQSLGAAAEGAIELAHRGGEGLQGGGVSQLVTPVRAAPAPGRDPLAGHEPKILEPSGHGPHGGFGHARVVHELTPGLTAVGQCANYSRDGVLDQDRNQVSRPRVQVFSLHLRDKHEYYPRVGLVHVAGSQLMSAQRRGTLIGLPAVDPPPLPDLHDIVSSETLRPGEFREPVTIDDPEANAALVAEAEACGLGPSQAASLMVEGLLLHRDLARMGFGADDASVRLDQAAARSRVSRPLADRDAAYLRALTAGGRPPAGAAPQPPRLSVSRRLLRRSTREELALAVTVPLEPLVRWEVAAVCEGRTLTEWAFATLLES